MANLAAAEMKSLAVFLGLDGADSKRVEDVYNLVKDRRYLRSFLGHEDSGTALSLQFVIFPATSLRFR